MRIEDISEALVPTPDGIYVSGQSRAVSYAEGGHESCLAVEDGSFWFRHRNDCIAALTQAHPFSGLMLDIGGGNGYVAKRLAEEGNQVVLLEPGMAGARNARELRGLDYVVCATVEDSGFKPGSFGALGMFDVIEHVEHDRAFLVVASELLAPGGKLYLTVPCHDWLWSGADVSAGHFRRHTEESVTRLLGGLFDIDYRTYFFWPLIAPQFLLRALPYKLGLTKEHALLSADAEHASGGGMAAHLMTRLLRHEVAAISRGWRIPVGASCLVAATKL